MHSSPAPTPDVTIVVIGYNDASRIAAAIRSALDQSLRNTEIIVADDASTDGTPEIAERMAAAVPERMRVIRLPENSGAGGRPRNVGMSHARGRYVMFLDSDDLLDRHAARNLFAAAEDTGADLVIGRTIRRYLERRVDEIWMAWLVRRRVVHESLSDQPDLLYDVLSTNKLYRRDFLVREGLVFPDGLMYQDNLFTAHAYLRAKKIAVIPHLVHIWHVEEKAAAPSISNRRSTLRNLVHRIAINRGIDAVMAEHGTPQLQLRKDVRFIENDLVTHLTGFSRLAPQARQALVDAAADYAAGLSPEAFRRAKRLPAIAAYLTSRRDTAGVASVRDYLVPAGRHPLLTTDLVERDGRVYWCDRHLDDPLGREILDVTALGLHDRPMSHVKPGARLTGVTRRGRTATLAGDVANPLGRITGKGDVRVTLVFSDRRRAGRRFAVPVTVEVTPTRLRWSTTFDPARAIRPIGLVDPVYAVRLHIVAGRETADLPLIAHPETVDAIRLPVRPRLGGFTGDLLEAYVSDQGDVALRLGARGRTARAGSAVIRRVRSTSLGKRAWRRARRAVRRLDRLHVRLTGRQLKLDVYRRFLTKLPVDPRRVIFESDLGRHCSGSPRAIYEELRRARPGYRPTWVYATGPAGFPEEARLVKRDSWAYFRALARARFWVDDHGFPADVGKRPETTYIQTWHGSPVKRMGFDDAPIKAQWRGAQQRLQRATDRFDVFLVRSEHDEQTLAKALRVRGELLPVGYPRNDALLTGGDPAEVAAVRRRLKVANGRQVVLYAPTFRASPTGGGTAPLVVPWLEEFAARYGERMILLVRPHPLAAFGGLPPAVRGAVRNVADVPDITPLYQLSDALITDFSSVMFDYALLGRPMIFHVPDHDDYVARRGTYFDLAEVAPGPITRTDGELLDALADLPALSERYAEKHRAFVQRFGTYDRGDAARSIVERYFTPGARRA